MGIKKRYTSLDSVREGLSEASQTVFDEFLAFKWKLKDGEYSICDIGPGRPDFHGSLTYIMLQSFLGVYSTLDYDARHYPTYVGDLTQTTPCADGQFDIVVCSEVLEHIYETKAALKELMRITGGILIITTPWVYKYHRQPEDYWRISPSAYEELLEELGAESYDCKFIGNEKHVWVAVAKSGDWEYAL